jgi:hypothetical protein
MELPPAVRRYGAKDYSITRHRRADAEVLALRERLKDAPRFELHARADAL